MLTVGFSLGLETLGCKWGVETGERGVETWDSEVRVCAMTTGGGCQASRLSILWEEKFKKVFWAQLQ